MTKLYYTLAIRAEGRWYPEFGDYDRKTVVAERQDRIEGDSDIRARDAVIITSLESQASIDAVIAVLNGYTLNGYAGLTPLANGSTFRWMVAQGQPDAEVYGWVEINGTPQKAGHWRTPDPFEAARRAASAYGTEVAA